MIYCIVIYRPKAYMSLLHELYHVVTSWFGRWCFVRITEGDAVKKLITFRECHSVEIRLGRGGVENPSCRTAQATRSDALCPCSEDDVLAKQTTVYLRHFVLCIISNADDTWSIYKNILEAFSLSNLWIVLYHSLGYRVDEGRRIYLSYLIRLQVLTIGRIDAIFQNVF